MNKIGLKSILPNSLEKLHHAYCLEGERGDISKNLREFLKDVLKFKIKGNPDFYFGDFDTLRIDDGRSIKEMQSRRAVSSSRRIFVIVTNFITKEAQNSLLKMFEEPSGEAVFFLVIPSISILLPTLRSRVMIVNMSRDIVLNETEKIGKLKNVSYAKKFLESGISERLDIVKKIIDKIAKEEESKFVAIEFLNDIERELLSESKTKESKIKNMFIFEEIAKCRSYGGDKSPSVKMLLEHIAMIV